MNELYHDDLRWLLRRLPKAVFTMMKERPNQLIVAGGFIRSCIANEKVSDVDMFSANKDIAELCARKLAGDEHRLISTDNAFTVLKKPFPVQFIHRWTYERPEDVVPSFDFTIARAAFWYDGKDWKSLCEERFYADLAAKRLVYCSPDRNEEAGGSLLRVLKFYQRGYRIPLNSFGAVMARLMMAVDLTEIGDRTGVEREKQYAKVITGLLHEVDPNVDPTHESHLPSTEALEKEAPLVGQEVPF